MMRIGLMLMVQQTNQLKQTQYRAVFIQGDLGASLLLTVVHLT